MILGAVMTDEVVDMAKVLGEKRIVKPTADELADAADRLLTHFTQSLVENLRDEVKVDYDHLKELIRRSRA